MHRFTAIWCLASVVLLQASAWPRSRPSILPFEVKYFTQYIDHFNYGGQAGPDGTYKQRYLIHDSFWARSRGPIFFYSGNEGPITGFWNASGFVHELAAKHRALVIFAEHRYYGTSLPFGDASFSKENIGFLSMEQALADYAVLLKALQSSYKAEDCKIASFGGSYGGMLSGYMRYKYPHIISAAVASSAPFYTIAGNRPRSEFFKAVTSTCHLADPICPVNVQAGFAKLQNLFTQGATGIKKIKETFNLCSDSMVPGLERHMNGWIRNAFTLMAMADYPYPASFLAPLPAYPINTACKYLADAEDKLAGLAKVTNLLYGSKLKCHDIYKEFVECADPTGCGLGNAAKAWDYQACTEMILPGGSTNLTDMFPAMPWTLEMRQEYCTKTWGLGKSRLSWVSTKYWGTGTFLTVNDRGAVMFSGLWDDYAKDIKQASNILFPNGNLDPWMPGGVLEDLSATLVAVPVKGGAHHLDLRGSNPADPEAVVLAREKIEKYLTKWLGL